MGKQERLIEALQKKLGSGSSSINVLLHIYKRNYPLMLDLASRISKASFAMGTPNEPSDEAINSLIKEIKNS